MENKELEGEHIQGKKQKPTLKSLGSTAAESTTTASFWVRVSVSTLGVSVGVSFLRVSNLELSSLRAIDFAQREKREEREKREREKRERKRGGGRGRGRGRERERERERQRERYNDLINALYQQNDMNVVQYIVCIMAGIHTCCRISITRNKL